MEEILHLIEWKFGFKLFAGLYIVQKKTELWK